MADIFLYNTLSGQKERFTPSHRPFLGLLGRPWVGMYHCGPTVYNYPHIGNLRTYVFADTLKRIFLANGYRVKQVINITDVGHLVSDADTGEDKMERASEREHRSAWEIAEFYTKAFMRDLQSLHVDIVGTRFPRATEYIDEQIAIVRELERRGFTYRTSDGIYFDTSKFPDYGKLGHIDVAGLREGERIGVNAEKRHPTDFALWKFSPEGAKRQMEWDSPWGKGFPGWHIECSAMSAALLGVPVDIHTGGIDHIPVHHNNEIAQSEAATGHEFVRYWMHSAFVNVDGGKMAKSGGSFITLSDVEERGFSPLAYRYFLLSAKYSTPLNFTWEALAAAATAYRRLAAFMREAPLGGRIDSGLYGQAISYVCDDLDTPHALALVWDIIRDSGMSPGDKRATILAIDRLLGLGFDRTVGAESEKGARGRSGSEGIGEDLPAVARALIERREKARAVKDWRLSDELREEIAGLGYEVKDTPEGQKVSRK